MMGVSLPLQLLLLNGFGLLLSCYLVSQHYASAGGGSRVCELGERVSCERVLHSAWAVIFNVPVAVHGVAYFVVALGMSFLAGSTDFRVARDASVLLVAVSCIGILSCLYFVAGELALGALCPLCTLVHAVVIASAWVAWQLARDRAATWTLSSATAVDLLTTRIVWLVLALAVVMMPLVAFNLPAEEPGYAAAELAQLVVCLKQKKVCGVVVGPAPRSSSTAVLLRVGAVVCFGHVQSLHQAKSPFWGSRMWRRGVLFFKRGAHYALAATQASKLRVVECSHRESGCNFHGIKNYPTWDRPGAERLVGYNSLADLALWAGCKLVPPAP